MGSPLSARAIEALSGAALGGLAVGGAGALTHETKVPTEWIDERGKFRSRSMTPSEKRERSDRVLKAALAGMALGSLSSLGAGAARRSYLKSSEASQLPEMLKERLTGLKGVVSEFEREAKRATIPGTGEAARRQARLGRATKMLEEQEAAIRKSLEDAAEARRGTAWGGLKLTGAGKMAVPHEELTHRGRVERHFRNLVSEAQKKHPDLPPLQSVSDAEEYGQKFFRSLLKKEASVQALGAEADAMYQHVPAYLQQRISSALQTLQHYSVA